MLLTVISCNGDLLAGGAHPLLQESIVSLFSALCGNKRTAPRPGLTAIHQDTRHHLFFNLVSKPISLYRVWWIGLLTNKRGSACIWVV
jgi:hypothetical protein